MASDLSHDDERILVSIAQQGALTVDQITRLHQRNANSLRRRLRRLRDQGFIDLSSRRLGANRGRPENLVLLGPEGFERLRAVKALPPADSATGPVKANCLEHELLVAEVRVQLAQMERLLPELKTRFFTATWPARTDSGEPFSIREKLDLGPDYGALEFVPDGVFSILHSRLGSTLLFFLEVDMGSQPGTSGRAPDRDIRRKIVNYQHCFGTGKYHRYERLLDCRLRGFRLLFVTESVNRCRFLCRQVRAMPPSDFVWLTDAGRLLKAGLWAAIWARGGWDTQAPESILGSQLPQQPAGPAGVAAI
ncbi:MAG TPA: replication-relaxation family protein [Phycisphaerae bacterium]|nr:replication-relaxation family protein [Phycisphaerae bacterium]